MMKFELARKYLVGFLALAVVLMGLTFPLTASAAPGPVVDASFVTVITAINPTSGTPTWPVGNQVTITIQLLDGVTPVNPPVTATMYIYNANIGPGSAVSATQSGVGTWAYDYPGPTTATIIPFVAYLDTTGSGEPNPPYNPSDPYNVEWANSVPAKVIVSQTVSTNVLTVAGPNTHTVSIAVKDQWGVPVDATPTPNVTIVGFNPRTPTNTGVSRTGTGFYTYTYNGRVPNSSSDPNGVYSFTDTISAAVAGATSDPASVMKTWSYTPTFTIVLTPSTGLNPVTAPNNTHTVTGVATDQFGRTPPTGSWMDFSVTGGHTYTASGQTNASGVASFTYTETTAGLDNITAALRSYTSTSNSVTKDWVVRTPSYFTFTQAGGQTNAYNMVGQTHYAYVKLFDQFGTPYTATTFTGTLQVVWHDTIAVTRYIPFTYDASAGTGTATVVIPAYDGGWDDISLFSVTPSFGTLPTDHVNKFWAHEYQVGSWKNGQIVDEVANVIGAPHDFVIQGAPFQRFNGQLYQNDHGQIKITGFQGSGSLTATSNSGTYNIPPEETNFDYSFIFSGYLDSTGSATITVYSKAPYKYYLEVNFENTINDDGRVAAGWPQDYVASSFIRTNTVTHYQVAKIYAKLTDFTLTPTDDLNPITASTTVDWHEVTVTARGMYQLNDEWYGPVPVGGARVDWNVTWADTFQRGVDDLHVGGVINHAGSSPIAATSYTDASGIAWLRYHLDISGTPSFHISPLFDHITANVHYSDSVLDRDYPDRPIPQTATKEWCDYGFKVIKVIEGDYTKTISNATFYLKTATGTYTYTDPNLVHNADTSATYNGAYYLVKTDAYGAAVWYHLPLGTYYVYELPIPGYLPPTNPIYTFTVPDIGYWNGNGTLFTTYISNTPTQPTPPKGTIDFWKWTWDQGLPGATTIPTVASGVVFTAHDETTARPDMISTSNATGLVTFSNIPVGTTTEWYRVRETTPPPGYLPIPDFFFYILPNGDVSGFYTDMTGSPTHMLPTPDREIFNYRGQVDFNKLTYCYSPLPGAQFTFTNLANGLIYGNNPATASATGLVLSGLLPVSNSATTWYRVNEISVPTGYLPVQPFYFYLAPDGTWNNTFYTDTTNFTPVWPINLHPENGVSAHWVIDQAAQAAVVTTILVDPATGTYDFTTQPTVAITVTVKDQLGNGVPNKTVAPVITGDGSVAPPSVLTDVVGRAHFVLTANTAGTVLFSATVDGKTGTGTYVWSTEQLAINDLTLNPVTDVSYFHALHVTANSPKSGTWTVEIWHPVFGLLDTLTAAGTNLDVTWAPGSDQGGLTAEDCWVEVELTDGVNTVGPETRFFDIYNYDLQITDIKFYDALFNPIAGPLAGVPFYVGIEFKNMFTGDVHNAYGLALVDGAYIGVSVYGVVPAGGVGYGGSIGPIQTLSAGDHVFQLIIWNALPGMSLANPYQFPVHL